MDVFSIEFLKIYSFGLAFGIFFFLFAWPISIKIKKANIIDVYWGYSFIFYFLFYLLLSKSPYFLTKIFLIIVCFIWCFRLGTYLLYRTLGEAEEDKRYTEIKKNWNVTDQGFWPMFVFQGFLSWLVSIPFAVLALTLESSILHWVGGVIALLGLFFESLSDKQLSNFKKDPSHRGTTCKVGFWKYSRHPNYFFEWTIWIGFFIASLSTKNGWIAIFSVIIMYRFLTKVSGAGYSEEVMLKSNKRQDYPEYVRKTNQFFPWFPKN